MIKWYAPRWIRAVNYDQYYTVPPYGLVQIYKAVGHDRGHPYGDGLRLSVYRPAGNSSRTIAANSWMPIPPGRMGFVTIDSPVIVDATGAGTMLVGDALGSVANSYLADWNQSGLTFLDDLTTDKSRVLAMFTRGGTYRKHLCRFKLDEDLTQSDGSAAATLQTSYGEGTSHSTTSITVSNLLQSDGNYLFEGDNGDYGYAYYHSGSTWIILQMECP